MQGELPTEVHLVLGEILGTTKHLVRQLDEVKENNKDFRKETRDEQQKLSTRISVVETFMWKAMGIAVAASTGIPIIITVGGYWLVGG